jgi:hypothetical protein
MCENQQMCQNYTSSESSVYKSYRVSILFYLVSPLFARDLYL